MGKVILVQFMGYSMGRGGGGFGKRLEIAHGASMRQRVWVWSAATTATLPLATSSTGHPCKFECKSTLVILSKKLQRIIHERYGQSPCLADVCSEDQAA